VVYSDTIPEGDIFGTWTLAGSPYLINGTTTVPYNNTLIIEPGVVVEWLDSYTMKVYGQILALGTESDSIFFTAADTSAGFRSIRFLDTLQGNDTSRFEFCIFRYGKVSDPWPDNCGGALGSVNYSKYVIDHCLFEFNTALVPNAGIPGGGAIALWNSSPVIRNSIFRNNLSVAGGAIICYEGSHPDIVNNIFTENLATVYGGAIICNIGSSPMISGNTFCKNTAEYGGALDIVDNCSPQVDHNLFYGNIANNYGGAISIYLDCSPNLINNTISNNAAADFGGGIAIEVNCFPVIRNTILWGNTAPDGSQLQINSADCVPDFYYSDLEGGADSIGGSGQPGELVGCIDDDPLFEGSDTCYYHLTEGSPCIDAGDPDCIDPIDSTICDMGAFWCNYLHAGIPAFPLLANGPNSKIQLKIYPNPGIDISHFAFRISQCQYVTLKIYDLFGREIRALVDEEKSPGTYIIRMNVSDLPAGVYLVRLQAANKIAVVKLSML
jgi:hypothetical protein